MTTSIAFFIYSLDNGGAERVTSILANEMITQNVLVTLVTMKPITEQSYHVDPKIQIISLSDRNKIEKNSSGILFNLKRIWGLRRLVRENNIDVLITMMTSANIVGILATLMMRTKCIISERIHPGESSSGRFWFFLRKHLYGKAHCVIVQSESGANWLRENTSSTNVEVIPNPLEMPMRNVEPFVPVIRTDSKLLMAAGRLTYQKQFHQLIEVFSQLPPYLDDWKLIIVGDGKERDSLQEQIKSLGQPNRIILAGRVGNISDWYRRASLFVMTSAYEGYPNALIEAMAHGLPVVSYNCKSGPSEVINNNVNGLLVDVNDTVELEKSLELLMSDSKKAEEFGRNAENIVDMLSPTAVTNTWVRLF